MYIETQPDGLRALATVVYRAVGADPDALSPALYAVRDHEFMLVTAWWESASMLVAVLVADRDLTAVAELGSLHEAVLHFAQTEWPDLSFVTGLACWSVSADVWDAYHKDEEKWGVALFTLDQREYRLRTTDDVLADSDDPDEIPF